ncbi:hypothetical protein HMPREF9396_1251 [Streptococcus sanguinis SK1059]|nr:hypothetical protein HMPREF9396_1251 [Streptococcus sanguinis SK1059]EGQ19743.1 hypothetical protein HMPREF8573_1241 [Streptococcus sanguinis ATCC 29667]EGQ23589.1 hypothetical protein HMPREF9387_1794 [Streptococcus sanguinis SK340]
MKQTKSAGLLYFKSSDFFQKDIFDEKSAKYWLIYDKIKCCR